jgi:hypothetical protein
MQPVASIRQPIAGTGYLLLTASDSLIAILKSIQPKGSIADGFDYFCPPKTLRTNSL